MAYVDQDMPADRKKAAAGVIIIHAAIGTVLVTGLAATFVPEEPPKPINGYNVEYKLPPPPPKPEEIEKPDDVIKTEPKEEIFTPKQPIEIAQNDPPITTTSTQPKVTNVVLKPIPTPGPINLGPPPAPPASKFDPVSAKPRNAPGGWITQSDYRPSWINREYTGIARFKLDVGSNGRAQNCQIVSSTGHSALDDATCKLAMKRARFNAARNGNGDKVSGSYSASVRWELPD